MAATIKQIEQALNAIGASAGADATVDGGAVRNLIGIALDDLHSAYYFPNESIGSTSRDLDAARLPLEAWFREIPDGPYPVTSFRANRAKLSRAYVEIFTAANRAPPASLGDAFLWALEHLGETLREVFRGIGDAAGAIPLGLFEGLLPVLIVAAIILVIVIKGGDKLGLDTRSAVNRGLKL